MLCVNIVTLNNSTQELKMYIRECEYCGTEFEPSRNDAKTCSDSCRKQLSRYSSKNIKIIDIKFDQRFDWKLAEDIAREYVRPIEWIRRSIKACRLAGVSPEYFIDKYILKLDRKMNESVDEEMRNLTKSDRMY